MGTFEFFGLQIVSNMIVIGRPIENKKYDWKGELF
jgi:hypothetical protein